MGKNILKILKKEKTEQNRTAYIDFLKGLGIILVVAGHCGLPSGVAAWVYTFHMPLFFFLSGLVYKNKDLRLKDYFVYKAKSLLYPYFVLGFLIAIYNTLIDLIKRQFLFQSVWRRLLALIYGNYIWDNNYQYIGTLWFLVALFCVEVIFYSVTKKCRSNRAVLISTAVITMFGVILSYLINFSRQFTPYNSGIRVPFCLDIALCALAYYCLGYFIKQCGFKNKYITLIGIIIFVSGSVLGVVNYLITGQRIDMLYLRIYNPILFYVSAMLCLIGLYFIFMPNEGFIRKYGKFISSIGQRSLLIMVIHLYLISYIKKLLDLVNLNNTIIVIVITLLISYLLALIVEKYFSFLYKLPKRKVVKI